MITKAKILFFVSVTCWMKEMDIASDGMTSGMLLTVQRSQRTKLSDFRALQQQGRSLRFASGKDNFGVVRIGLW